MGSFKSILKLLRSGYSGDLNVERDSLASEYPAWAPAGMGMLNAATGASVSMASLSMQVPSGKIFHLKDMFMFAAANTFVYFYDGPGVSQAVGALLVSQSGVYHFVDMHGWLFQSIPMVSYTESVLSVKLGGLIRDRDQGT